MKAKYKFLSVFTILILAVTLFMPGSVYAATLCVEPTGTPGCYTSIQDAVNAASPGDTISIMAGTYSLDSTLNLNKENLTLQGVGNPLIQVSGTGYRFLITAGGVTLDGLRIEKTDTASVQNIIGIQASNTSITNNEIFGQFVPGVIDFTARAMEMSGGITGLNVSGNTIHNLRQPAYINTPVLGTISNNYVYDTKGWVVAGGGVTFTGNTWGTGPDVNVYDIAIINGATPGYYPDIVAMSAANNGAVIEDQRVSPAVLSVVYVDAATSFTSDLGGRYHPYSTITPALARVVAGGTIHVAAGTYVEQVNITKSLHLVGAGAGSSIIQAPATLPAASLPASAIVLVSGSGVDAELTGFTVTGPGPSACGSIRSGIYIRDNANANIHDNSILDIRDAASPVSGCQNGVAILVGRQAWATSGTATIADNTILGYQKGGIVVDNTGSNATITNNTITGAGTINITAQNGIQISRGATATLSGNTVTGNSYHNDSNISNWGAAGILLYQSGAVTLSGGNTIAGNDQNLYKYGASGVLTMGAETLGPSTAPAEIGSDIVNFDALAIDAISVTFTGAADGFAIEDRVWHVIDEAGLGLVTWLPNNVYITPLSESYQAGAIQRGVNAVAAGGTVNVAVGTFDEDVNVNKPLSLIGAGAGSTTLRGVLGGDGATIRVSASNATIAGFTITRLGNNTTDWNNAALNSVGIAIQGTTLTGTNIHANILFGNRTGIDINASSGHTIHNNAITDNRTGLIFRNQTDNMTVTNNDITNNWTVGVLFLDASLGSNNPLQTALNSTFSNNNISGNWYGQAVDRQTGGSLPLPGTTNLKNFSPNWWGTVNPVVSIANSAEPGYAVQIPVAYGGTATAPGGQPDILGTASANIQYTPWLCSGTDTSAAIGFQPTGQTDCSSPAVTGVSVSPSPVYSNALTTVTAVADDSGTGNSNIKSAEYNLNNAGWLPMTAADGAFDGTTENVQATFTAATAGSNQVCVRATDSWGNTSPVSCHDFTVHDPTPPVITPNMVGTPGNNDWYTSDVTVNWNVVDDESQIASQTGCTETTISTDTLGITLTCTATSAGGTSSQSVTIKRDTTKPTLSPVVSPNPVLLNGIATATPNASDATSEVAFSNCAPVDTSTAGAHYVTCYATDNAGNSNSAAANYSVGYKFTVFSQPIDMNAINIAKAGQTIPVKWRLTDANGLPVSDPASFVQLHVQGGSCPASASTDAIENYSASSGLQYLGDGYWQFNWKTLKSSTGCRSMYVEFVGGVNSPTVMFQFK